MIAATVNNARYTYKRMAPQATSQWAQVGIPGPRGLDPVAAAADRLFAAVQTAKVAATGRNSVRAAPATLGSRHSNGSFGPFIRRPASRPRRPGPGKRAAKVRESHSRRDYCHPGPKTWGSDHQRRRRSIEGLCGG